ncbi:hypothetical protein MTO96_003273 [Rhipicephalus appendiculatus]
MDSWWLIMLLSSQAILMEYTVDATFDISFRWLRPESTVSTETWNATTAAVTTESTVSLTTPTDVASTEDSLSGRSTKILADNDAVNTAAPTTSTTAAATTLTTERTTGTTETGASTTATTETAMPGATPVSLDDLALQIGNVSDPVLHVVENRHGSHSFVIISGRDGPSETTTEATTTPATEATTKPVTTTPATEATTTPATTAPATEATTTPATTPATEVRTTPPPSTTLFGTTLPAASNTTSPYLILLRYLRPFIFGRFGGADSTASTTEATTVATPALSTVPPSPGNVPNSNPATTETTVPTTAAAAASTTVPTASTTEQTISPTPTAVPDEDLATYPAEFRVTEPSDSFTTQDPLGNSNASFTQAPSTRGANFDTTTTPTSTPPSSYVSTTTVDTTASDADEAQTSIFSTTPVTSESTTSVTTVTSETPTTPSISTPVTGTTVASEVPATLDGVTTEDPASAQTSAPGQLGSLVFRLNDEAATHTPRGEMRRATFAPWPPTAAPNISGGDGADDEPKYRYFYDPSQVMQVL